VEKRRTSTKDQLVASAGSIAASHQEARGASSRREFARFNELTLRSANESALWLRAFESLSMGESGRAIAMLDEARQLARILATIVVRTKSRPPER
jgi:four helix bundle protein